MRGSRPERGPAAESLHGGVRGQGRDTGRRVGRGANPGPCSQPHAHHRPRLATKGGWSPEGWRGRLGALRLRPADRLCGQSWEQKRKTTDVGPRAGGSFRARGGEGRRGAQSSGPGDGRQIRQVTTRRPRLLSARGWGLSGVCEASGRETTARALPLPHAPPCRGSLRAGTGLHPRGGNGAQRLMSGLPTGCRALGTRLLPLAPDKRPQVLLGGLCPRQPGLWHLVTFQCQRSSRLCPISTTKAAARDAFWRCCDHRGPWGRGSVGGQILAALLRPPQPGMRLGASACARVAQGTQKLPSGTAFPDMGRPRSVSYDGPQMD